jgi:hypothetical protein
MAFVIFLMIYLQRRNGVMTLIKDISGAKSIYIKSHFGF